MSLDDPRFRFAPHCILSALTAIYPGPNDTWETTNEHGITGILTNADFRRRCVTIQSDENGEGIYSVIAEGDNGRPRKFAINTAEKTVAVEGFEQEIDLAEFRRLAVRCTPEGQPICSLAQTLYNQWQKCKETGGADDHLMDIREMSALYADSKEVGELYDHHMYNLISSDMDDGKTYLDLMKMITAPNHIAGPVHQRFGLDEVLDSWNEVRNLPTFMQANVRVAFDNFMKEMLGDYPYEKVVMTCTREEQFSEQLEDGGFELIGMLDPFVGGNMLPGYKTSDVAFHRSNGADVVVFTDFMGTYAYAWPTEEGGKFEPPAMRIPGIGGM